MANKKTKKFINILPVFLVLHTYKNWRQDRTLRLGAGIAYYGVFAIVPLVTLMVSLATYFFSSQDINIFLNSLFSRIFGSDLSSTLSAVADKLTAGETGTFVTSTSIIGVVSLFISASFIFLALQDALDAIWHNGIRLGWKKWIKKYIWAYVVVLIASTLLVVALLINTIGSLAVSLVPGQLVIVEKLTTLVVSLGSWAVGIFVLTIIYKFLIQEKISWSILVIGASATSVLIVVGTWLLGFYITNFASESLSGALGAALLFLIWIYYEAQIILIGAQFIKTLNQNNKKLPAVFSKY